MADFDIDLNDIQIDQPGYDIDLNDIQIEQDNSRAQLDAGGLGYPVSKQEARRIAGERIVKRARAAGKEDVMTGAEIGRPDVMFATPTGVLPQAKAFASDMASGIPIIGALTRPLEEGAEALATKAGLGEQAKTFSKTNLQSQMPLTAFGGGVAGSLAGGGVAGKTLSNPLKGAPIIGGLHSGAVSATDQLSATGEIDPEQVVTDAGKGAILGLASAGLIKGATAVLPKRLQMSSEVGSPIVDTKKTPNKTGDHFIDPIDIYDTSTERLLARSAPFKGAPQNTIKSNDATKKGYFEAFRIDPEATKTPGGTLQVVADHAPEIYKQYLAIGNSRPDIQLPTQGIHDGLYKFLGEAPSAEIMEQAIINNAAYGKTISLPGAIQKLEQINAELGPMIKQGNTGNKYKLLMAEAQALRSTIDPAIEQIGGKQAKLMRETYGHMTELSKNLGRTVQKLDNNIPPEQRGSLNDVIGIGEILTAGGHAYTHGLNPLAAIGIIDGIMRKSKGADKAFWTDTNKMMGNLNSKLKNKVGRADVLPTPEGFFPTGSALKMPGNKPMPPPSNIQEFEIPKFSETEGKTRMPIRERLNFPTKPAFTPRLKPKPSDLE